MYFTLKRSRNIRKHTADFEYKQKADEAAPFDNHGWSEQGEERLQEQELALQKINCLKINLYSNAKSTTVAREMTAESVITAGLWKWLCFKRMKGRVINTRYQQQHYYMIAEPFKRTKQSKIRGRSNLQGASSWMWTALLSTAMKPRENVFKNEDMRTVVGE